MKEALSYVKDNKLIEKYNNENNGRTNNMGTLNYKGYIGSVNYSVEDDCLYGRVMGLPKNITIIYEGESIKDLRTDFENAIDNYLNSCEEKVDI